MIDQDFIKNQYRSGVQSYADFTREVGLWASEKAVFQQYLRPEMHILDLGCGTGRTTFPLHELGYQQIIGVDLTPEMIAAAQKLNAHFQTAIDFRRGDATQLEFVDQSFDAVIFSFNGIMSIPGQGRRDRALAEIKRVLQPGGPFIFTTHDRGADEQYLDFWRAEKERWQAGEQSKNLYDFGDLITTSKNEEREIYLHIPSQQEVVGWLQRFDFKVVDTFFRPERFAESPAVLAKSGPCRFWVAR
ncbi:MAG: class I SAM-dependent methyltransferase [Bacteroidota bacterium]